MNETEAQRLSTHLERWARRHPRVPAPQVLISGPDCAFTHGDLERAYHGASIDKVFTATVIGRLVDMGRLRFDAPLGTILPAADIAGLPAAPGCHVGRDVTVGHLLTHTSGLPDYFLPPRRHHAPTEMSRVVTQPDRKWTCAELLDVVRTLPPMGRPGERFHYSDTAYLLLDRVAEETGEAKYADLLSRFIFEPAGMTRTRMPFDDALTAADLEALDLAPLWFGGRDVSHAMCLSVAWGSVVTVAHDLVRFQDALHGGNLLKPETLGFITHPRHRFRAGIHYGAGAVTLRFGEFSPFLRHLPEPVGGLGLSAAHMFYYPAQRTHVVLNFHSTRAMRASFQTHFRIARALPRGSVVKVASG